MWFTTQNLVGLVKINESAYWLNSQVNLKNHNRTRIVSLSKHSDQHSSLRIKSPINITPRETVRTNNKSKIKIIFLVLFSNF